MHKLKGFIKYILWSILPKKNGGTVLKVRNGPAKGVKLNLDLRKEGSYWLGNYDQWIFDSISFSELIKKGDVVWDAGAYVGYYTGVFRKLVGDTGNVVTFEASTTNYNRLKHLPSINKWDNVSIHYLAVGPDHSRISFVDSLGGSNGPYALDKVYNEKDKTKITTVEVECCGVDELVYEKNIPAPDFIKFDLESAEVYALHNGDRLFKEKRPTILLELHGEQAKNAAGLFLEKYNYKALTVGSFKNGSPAFKSLDEFNKIVQGVPHMIVCQPLN